MWVTVKSNSLIDWKLQEETADLFFLERLRENAL